MPSVNHFPDVCQLIPGVPNIQLLNQDVFSIHPANIATHFIPS